MKRFGILTGGGDAPGLNPAIRAAVYKSHEVGAEVLGICEGWKGLLDEDDNEIWPLDRNTVRTWDRKGGTALGSSRTNPFYSNTGNGTTRDRSKEVLTSIEKLNLDGLIAIGGEDTLGVACRLAALGAPVVGIPKTIDKDLAATDYTLGFDTSLRTVSEVIEKSRTPAGSHGWVQVIEVMGRHAGHLALWSGLAGGAFMTLIPEYPFQLEKVYSLLSEHLGQICSRQDGVGSRYAVVVVAEGAKPIGQDEYVVDSNKDAFGHARLGGIGAWLSEKIRNETRFDSRVAAIGHPQRGGPPSPVDRSMGWLYGVAAVEALEQGAYGKMVCARGIAPAVAISLVPLVDAVEQLNVVNVQKLYDQEKYTMKSQVVGDV